MSRRTHGLVALLATGVLVALLLAWWAPAHSPGGPTASPTLTLPTETVASAPIPTGRPPVAVPGATITPCRRTGEPVPLTVVTFNIHSAIGHDGLQLEQI